MYHAKLDRRYANRPKHKVELMKKLPIGIQSFEKLIKDNYLYVDKTLNIFRLISEGQHYFLSRPRRFGKSLLLTQVYHQQGSKPAVRQF